MWLGSQRQTIQRLVGLEQGQKHTFQMNNRKNAASIIEEPSKTTTKSSKTSSSSSSSTASATSASTKSKPVSSPFLNTLFSRGQQVIQYVSFAVLAFFLLHYAYSIVEGRLAENELADRNLVRFANVNGVRTMYHCIVADPNEPITATAWIVHGVGSSWIINTPPLWYIHNKLKGIEFCSYARPGFAFTGGVANATDVDGTTNHFLELVANVTPKDRPVFLIGHSYGGAISILAASEMRSSNRSPAALVLLDSMPVLLPADNATAEDHVQGARVVMDKLVKLASSAEIASLLGLMRVSMASQVIERLETQMKYIPAEYHRAFRHEVSSPSLWKSMIAEVERSNLTGVHLSRLVKSVWPVKLLGDLPLLIVRATDFAIMSADEVAHWHALVDADVAPTLSTHVEATEIKNADHMFYGDAAPKIEQIVIDFLKKHLKK